MWRSAYLLAEGTLLALPSVHEALNDSGGAETGIQPLPEPELAPTTREHWCAEHQQSFTQKNGKDGSSWWSHKAPDGSWCRE